MSRVKTHVDELAIFHGRPAFDEPLHVGRPNVGDRPRLIARINDLLDRRWLTNNGPFVSELEQRICEFLSVRNCVAMCNGTVALEIAIRALGLEGEVILPSMTFVATAHALQWQQIKPVFCDIGPTTFTIDPHAIEGLITERTTGIIGVHLWGNPCAVDQLADIAARRQLKVIYDAAHAFACSTGGQMIGNFGAAEVFSFHATKFLNTFEGGAVVTNDDELAAKIRLMKNFGFSGYDTVGHLGTNGKMSEISAAMGLTGLETIDETIAVNRSNYNRYRNGVIGVPGVRLTDVNQRERSNYQYVVLLIDRARFGLSRDQLVDILWAENIRARRYFYPGCHRMEPYRTLYPDAGRLLPQTEARVEETLTLPTGTGISADDIDVVCGLLQFASTAAPDIAARFTDHRPARA
jgi:dTDP-4-amino-4,6-dideoxygalactose transaminase